MVHSQQKELILKILQRQQNLTSPSKMQSNTSQRSLSPLGKDPLSVGKLFKSKRVDQSNPQTFSTNSLLKNQSQIRDRSPKTIGINTSRTNLTAANVLSKYQINENEVKPITHYKVVKEQAKQPLVKPVELTTSSEQPKLRNRNRFNHKGQADFVPAVVDFPTSYEYDENDDLPQTPDLPNRTSINSQVQTKLSPIIYSPVQIEQKVEPGVIKHQNRSRIFSNSAPKDFNPRNSNQNTELFQSSSPQLPYINKIQSNVNGFKKFINQPTNASSAQIRSQINYNNFKNITEAVKKYRAANNNHNTSLNGNNVSLTTSYNSPYLRRKSLTKNVGQIIKKSNGSDPQQQQKLEQRKNFRISSNNFHTSRIKLPTFRQENKQQFQQQVQLDRSYHLPSGIKNKSQTFQLNKVKSNIQKMSMNSSVVGTVPAMYQQQQSQPSPPGTLFSASFLKNTVQPNSQNTLSIDLRTSIQKLKQTLIQSSSTLSLNFNLPSTLFNPPTSSSTSHELHNMMLDIFTNIGINPQIVSIKKYINCVVMRDKKLCLLWNFNGKVYFGGWKKNQMGGNGGQGWKDGVGVEWVPHRYIYYGQWRDNKKQGYGLMKKSNKEVYIGCWKNNMRWGWGKVYDTEGNLHQNGQFIEGCFIYPQKGYRDTSINSQDKNV